MRLCQVAATLVVFLLGVLPGVGRAEDHIDHDADVRQSVQPENSDHVGAGLRAGIWGGFSGVGVEAFFRPVQNDQVSVLYMNGNDLSKRTGNSESVEGQLLSLQYRRFLGSSFSVVGGLGWRKLVAHYEQGHRDFSETRGDYQIDSIVVSSDVGNLWSWSNGLFVGGDWLGFIYSINDRTKNDVTDYDISAPNGRGSQSAGSEVRTTAQKFSLRTSLTAGVVF